MTKRLTTISFVMLLSILCSAQNGDFRLGGRSAAIGGASVANSDAWSLFNNVGSIGAIDQSSGFLTYQNRFNISAFQVVGAGYTHHSSFGNVGLGVYRFGDDLFNQQKLSVGFGNTIDKVSLGLSVNLIQYHVETIGTTKAFVIGFGGLVQLLEGLSLGAHVYNLNQANITNDLSVPTVIKTGLSYQLGTSVLVNLEIQKDLDFAETLKAGIEYELIKNAWIRTGVSSNPTKAAFGAGFRWKKSMIDYAFNDQSVLGATHELSLAYLIPSKK